MFEPSDAILQARHLCKQFPVAKGKTLTAVQDANLDVYYGKTLGIVGESGCGKSTLARMIAHMETPTSGEIILNGENIVYLQGEALRQHRQHMQMVFQDPLASFHPKMKMIDILTEPLMNFGRLVRGGREQKARELLEMVGLPDSMLYRYPHSMSGGQRQRIGIARALSLEPEILICDEATSALDVSIQDTIISLLVKLQREKGISILFICHDIALIQAFAHQIAVMYLGHIVEVLPRESVAKGALHPYTQALVGALFSVHMNPAVKLQSIEGEAPSPLELPIGCPFQNRCPHCMEQCKQELPELIQYAPGHFAACHYTANGGKPV